MACARHKHTGYVSQCLHTCAPPPVIPASGTILCPASAAWLLPACPAPLPVAAALCVAVRGLHPAALHAASTETSGGCQRQRQHPLTFLIHIPSRYTVQELPSLALQNAYATTQLCQAGWHIMPGRGGGAVQQGTAVSKLPCTISFLQLSTRP
jgi:hypothetical protein